MATSFPDICPQRRNYTAGKYSVKRFQAYSGVTTTRLYGDKPFDAAMSLGYLLSDSDTSKFLKSYHDSKGGSDSLTMPAGVLNGVDATLIAEMKTYTWRWQSAPQVESIRPGLSRIQVSLIGTLDA